MRNIVYFCSRMVFRKAKSEDIDAAAQILRMAAERMLAEGKHQWDATYPDRSHVAADIEAGIGYVLDVAGEIVAYGAVVFDGEPAYARIAGRWLSDEGPYVVVHRLAVRLSDERRGLGAEFLREVEKLALSNGIRNFRIDTNYDNDRMLRLLEILGFSYCGRITYDKGERMAFEKLL